MFAAKNSLWQNQMSRAESPASDLRDVPDLAYAHLFWMPDAELESNLEKYLNTKGKGKIRTAQEVVALIRREMIQRKGEHYGGDAVEHSRY